jgi:hypothetical protein
MWLLRAMRRIIDFIDKIMLRTYSAGLSLIWSRKVDLKLKRSDSDLVKCNVVHDHIL